MRDSKKFFRVKKAGSYTAGFVIKSVKNKQTGRSTAGLKILPRYCRMTVNVEFFLTWLPCLDFRRKQSIIFFNS